MAARSPEPANRCAKPQSLSASAAGRRRVSMSASTSMAADRRAPGVMALSCAVSAAMARVARRGRRLSILAAHCDHGEIRIGQEMVADWALPLEQLEPRGAFLALSHGDRVEHRVDADELLDILLELVDAFHREADVVH